MYEISAPNFDDLYPHSELATSIEDVIPALTQFLGIRVDARFSVIDLCCGTGRALRAFATKCPNALLCGVDTTACDDPGAVVSGVTG